MDAAPRFDGSWWPAWQQWLAAHSGARVKPPATGAASKGYAAIDEAPGQFVRQR
jgi:polyhydroxyalkanoate synthase